MRLLCLTIAVLCLCVFVSTSVTTTHSTSEMTKLERHVFTWISKVTPELASWAKNMSFTDVVVLDSSAESYLNLANAGITYWYLVTSYGLDPMTSDILEHQLVTIADASPNGHVYLDDSHRLLELGGVTAIDNLFCAIRKVQASNNCKFILNGYVDSFSSTAYPKMNMTGIDFDVYQPLTVSYESVIPLLETSDPATIGIYVWAYRVSNGVSWSTMTESYLDSVYEQAKKNGLSRVVVWNGYSGILELSHFVVMCASCLYNYPEWWSKVKLENQRFLTGN